MDLSGIKLQARALIKKNKKTIYLASFLYLLLAGVLSVLSFLLTGPDMDTLCRYFTLFMNQQFEAAIKVLQSYRVGTLAYLVSNLLGCLGGVVSFGFSVMILRAIRGHAITPGNLLDGFSQWARVILLQLAIQTLVSLGMLLIVPGVILAYCYRMAPFLLILHPDYGILDCMRESRRRSLGRRMNFFTLDLSFLGWLLLCCIPVVGWALMIWVLPYYEASSLFCCMAVNSSFETLPKPEEETSAFLQ